MHHSTLNAQRSTPHRITIHVFDEARGARRDFSCDLALLLREMRYFRSHLSGTDVPTQAGRVRVQGQGFRVKGQGSRVYRTGFRVQGSGLRAWGSGFWG